MNKRLAKVVLNNSYQSGVDFLSNKRAFVRRPKGGVRGGVGVGVGLK
jgi:hypothetical protein